MVQKKQNKLNDHYIKPVVQELCLKKNVIPRSTKTVSQSSFPPAQLTYSMLATKNIHQTNTSTTNK